MLDKYVVLIRQIHPGRPRIILPPDMIAAAYQFDPALGFQLELGVIRAGFRIESPEALEAARFLALGHGEDGEPDVEIVPFQEGMLIAGVLPGLPDLVTCDFCRQLMADPMWRSGACPFCDIEEFAHWTDEQLFARFGLSCTRDTAWHLKAGQRWAKPLLYEGDLEGSPADHRACKFRRAIPHDPAFPVACHGVRWGQSDAALRPREDLEAQTQAFLREHGEDLTAEGFLRTPRRRYGEVSIDPLVAGVVLEVRYGAQAYIFVPRSESVPAGDNRAWAEGMRRARHRVANREQFFYAFLKHHDGPTRRDELIYALTVGGRYYDVTRTLNGTTRPVNCSPDAIARAFGVRPSTVKHAAARWAARIKREDVVA